MGDQRKSMVYLAQLRAMLKRNLLLKKRDKRRTMAEVLLPIYTLGVLFLIKVAVPNPNFPEINQPRGAAELMANFRNTTHTIVVVPNSTEVQDFLKTVDVLWENINEKENRKTPELSWVVYPTLEDLLTAYWLQPNDITLAVIFQSPDPINGPLSYEIRTNPNLFGTPSTTQLFGSPASCREYNSFWQNVPGVPTPVLPEGLEVGDSCPVNQYYYSGFLAMQVLLDFTKIRLDAGIENLLIPQISLELFPKASYTGNWMVIVRVLIPLYTVIALSQFITYLLILIVGEKEKKIKEGMKIMGLYDSVFWLSWFIIYAIFVLLLTIICCTLLFALNIFTNTSFVMVFMLIFMYCLSIIMFGFMLTPFFDKSRTAGILGNFAVTILSLLYFIQVFVRDSSSVALWFVSLISPAGFALAMDKALLMDLAGEGVNISNVWDGPDMPFGGSLIMMAVDVVLYGWIAYYLDCVIPSEYGVKRSPFFCFNPFFWCKSKPADKVPLTNGESVGSVGSLNTAEEALIDFEPVPREMKGKEAIRIVDLCKNFKTFRKPEVKAVNGINLTIYQGHITAILGHNGAGKTTLFNILTGLTAPTSGTAYIFGYDVRNQNEMDQIRRMTGVCPQHDILFDNLTPKEHLEFFATVKGIPSSKIDQEVKRTLQDVVLTEEANVSAIHLSGGQKRKLSVGIAVIGDPKIIILDEPTAGVDPYSRRHMWNVLQNRRHGKVILLTTHFMDEADILADRKAVVSKGSIRCCGSSLFLKNKFGIGYHLTLVLEGNAKEQAIARLVTTHVSKAEKARRHGRELSFILPHNAVDHFAPLFSAIEQEIDNKNGKLGISSYGVSMTTLEEVFLHLEKGEDEPDEAVDNLSKKIVRNRALSRSLSLQSKSTSYQSLHNEGNNIMVNGQDFKGGGDVTDIGGLEAISETRSPISGIGLEKIECHPNACQTILSLIKLRALRMFRDIQKLYFMILLPLLCAALSLYFNNYFQNTDTTSRPLELNGTTYGDMSTIAIHNGSDNDITDLIDQLISLGVRQTDSYNGNFSSLLDFSPHLAAFDVHKFQDGDYGFTILYNDTFQHSLPVTLNLLSNTIYRILTPEKVRAGNFEPIKVMAQPFQQTMQPEGINIASTTQTIFVGMVFVMVPVSLAIDLVYDRELKTKNQLRVNGLSTTMYFLTYFIVLIVIMCVTCTALVIMMVVFDIPALREWPAIVVFSVLIFLYCPSSILSCTCISYIFDKTDSAQSILPNIATFVGWIPFVFVVMLDVMNIGKTISLVLHCIFSLTNTMYIPYSIVYCIQRVYLLCNVNLACDRLTLASYFTTEIGVLLVGMILNIPLWFVLLRIVDIKKSGGKASDAFKFLKKERSEETIVEEESVFARENEDEDVKAEREKVTNLRRSHNVTPPVVMVQDLYKEYRTHQNTCCACCLKADEEQEKTKVAVKSLSLAVDAGEVFGLLGHNGAGKTTTMKIITAEEAPTRGKVFIGGQSITSNLNSAFQLLGYCPQHDALWRNITVREHMETYAAIRGVPRADIRKIVNRYINGLQIQDHADKQTKMCSGGTKRKLSFAMAMIGNPKIVLLDEPSTGMDPRSKRFLWDTILASFQGSKGAILTTHSMEEADALCSRVGITVKGQLRCLGSTQHLKNLYGAGYTLEVKLKVGDSTPGETPTSNTGEVPTLNSGGRKQELKDFVAGLFPDACQEEDFQDKLVFSVPQQSVPSLANCFMQLEKAKLELNIEEYSFSQTTLEQVFLKFAQYDATNSE